MQEQEHRLCYCNLSGDIHVVAKEGGKKCDQCDFNRCVPITPESIANAFRFYQGRVTVAHLLKRD